MKEEGKKEGSARRDNGTIGEEKGTGEKEQEKKREFQSMGKIEPVP